MRATVTSLLVSAALLLSAPTAAAAERPGYPATPPELTLEGTSATAQCVSDVPWIDYSVVLTGATGPQPARLVMTDGTQSVTIPLGTVQDGRLDGRVLWPGAAVDADGDPTAYPGYVRENGEWVPTDGNFAWTRGDITAEIRVNPEIVIPLSYPPSTAACMEMDSTAAAEAGSLPTTGGTVQTVVLAGGAGLLVAGIGALLLRRRRS
jgi:LPXTG-motif cell wall-anchored protein